MKMVKSILLGSAAGLLAMSGAQAADLPVKAKAVEYVKVCSLYGAGFYYIPGTDTCLKFGGYLRVDVAANTNTDNIGNVTGQGGVKNRYTNGYTWRSREDFSIDTRTATEYGVVRTFADVTWSWTTDSYAGSSTGFTVYGPLGTGTTTLGLPNNAGSGTVAGGTLGVYYAFIQFAGFTIGKAVSQFSAPWANYPGNNFDGLVGGGGDVTGVNQFTYTWQFGNGVSFALSAQDQVAYYQAGNNNLGTSPLSLFPGPFFGLGAYGASDIAGSIAPDFVAMARADQAWGMIQGSIALHDNHVAYYGNGVLGSAVEPSGHPDDKWGWAAQLALQIKNIPTGAGDDIKVQGVYTDGATRYNIQDLAGQYGAVGLFGGSGLPGVYGSVALNAAPDTVFVTGGSQHSIQTWGMRGAFNHNWDAYWSSSLYGAYAAVRYDDFSKTAICGPGGLGGGSFPAIIGGLCNPDYNIGQLGFITRWTPVKNLAFSADVTWSHIDQKNSGVIVTGNPFFGKPVTFYELKDQDNVLFLLRAQRNW